MLLAACLASNPRMSMPPVSDGGTEVSLVGGKERFVPGMFWPRRIHQMSRELLATATLGVRCERKRAACYCSCCVRD